MDEQPAQRQLRKDLVISALAVASLGIGVYDLLHPRTSSTLTWLDALDLAIVLLFIVDFTYSARRSGNWRSYTKRHWYELPALLPITGNMGVGAGTVPLLRGVRLVRLVRVFRLLRVIGTLTRLERFWSGAFRIARRPHLVGLAVFALTVIALGAVSAWFLESASNPRMAAPVDAVRWALNMFSNVAYVDIQPGIAGGRAVAAALELTGIGFIGLFTASLANAFFRDTGEETKSKGEKAPLE